MEFINVWNFPYKVSVSVNKEFLKLLKGKLKIKYKNLKVIHATTFNYQSYSYFKQLLSLNLVWFRDLKFLVDLCKLVDIPLSDLEKNILAYRTTRGRCEIENPKLPVIITPLFDMIVGHIFGDGNSVKTEGRELYFNYRQFDKTYRDLFIKKVENIFGLIRYNHKYFDSLKRVYLPTIVSSIIANYYSLKSEDFLSDRCIIPDKMFSHSKEHLLAFLVSIIIDEGYIDSAQIVIALNNKNLIYDLSKICDILNYEYKITQDKKIKEKWILYILADGTKTFWSDYLNLRKTYPLVDLGYKGNQIKDFILRKKKKWRTSAENVNKNSIIRLLKERSMTIKDLSKILLISRQGTRFHIKNLEKMDLVKIVGKGKENSNLYKLVKYVKLPVKKRGRSRQYNVTYDNIFQLLMEFGKLDTKAISKKLNMKRTTVYTLLKNLERKHKIKAVGEKVYKTHPCIIWSLT